MLPRTQLYSFDDANSFDHVLIEFFLLIRINRTFFVYTVYIYLSIEGTHYTVVFPEFTMLQLNLLRS